MWIEVGLDLESYWRATPREIILVLQARTNVFEREHNARAWMVWHLAALQRMKKLPNIDKLMYRRKQQRQTPQQMKEIIKMIHALHGGKTKRK